MITKHMTMNEILDMHDSMGDILMSYGLDCRNCSGAYGETLEEAATGHGVELEELIKELNRALNKAIN